MLDAFRHHLVAAETRSIASLRARPVIAGLCAGLKPVAMQRRHRWCREVLRVVCAATGVRCRRTLCIATGFNPADRTALPVETHGRASPTRRGIYPSMGDTGRHCMWIAPCKRSAARGESLGTIETFASKPANPPSFFFFQTFLLPLQPHSYRIA
jgi:hypothetical protein